MGIVPPTIERTKATPSRRARRVEASGARRPAGSRRVTAGGGGRTAEDIGTLRCVT
ncbi:MAG: hypothetical protein AVDCRST_MAG13-1066 [uncultured Solirubrobacteraceae bacterium]|uniref:Uncharacterized protein n=1 Tax=uncultured Solirubrobacteraceae bacterium TaxID=1162706 RepID=A0A6J4RUH3_9ACTN|nr:MAG: hypothetical protein AVDCRST_MAG13-1066 [uncultured Solirubrobacteraceae bacterium]